MQPINVTKTFLPPIGEYQAYIERIWQTHHIANNGPLQKEFEEASRNYLGIDNFHFVSNGTLALQVALHSLEITSGEIITTPFSYVASVSSILWERCVPVFVDIEPESFCIDPTKIEAAITNKTKAILAVHVFGNPCDVEAIEAIAQRHGIKIIYDAAHAFGVKYKGKQLLDYGHLSTCSFHATKPFHTIEGGCIISKDKTIHDKIELIKRFGHHGDDHFMLGINAKPNEFQSAMGLCNLKYIDQIIEARDKAAQQYDLLLGNSFQRQKIRENTQLNYAYYPILFEKEASLLEAIKNLNQANIYPRRYFYPSLNTLPYLDEKQSCPISENIASRILCLPLYYELESEIIERIVGIIKK